MSQKPTLKRPEPLTAAIIADMKPGDERGDAQCAGLRVRCQASGKKVFFYRYRAKTMHCGKSGWAKLGR